MQFFIEKASGQFLPPKQPMHRHNYISVCYWGAMASPASAIPTLLLDFFFDNRIFFFFFPCPFTSSLICSPNRLLQLQEDLGVIFSLLSDSVGYQINFNCKPQDYAKTPSDPTLNSHVMLLFLLLSSPFSHLPSDPS